MTTLHDFVLDATRRYLQSVVFVDDEIYIQNSIPDEISDDIPSEISVFKEEEPVDPGKGKTIEGEPVPAEEKPPFHPKNLVESFAKERMVCALYEPPPDFSCDAKSEIFRLCERADAVILDWDLYNEDGRNILPLISGLVEQSQSTVPHHVRLCVVYTTKPNLVSVANQIYEDLRGKDLQVEEIDTMRLAAGSSRIVVLGKSGVSREEEQKKAEVAETDLAQRIICEFGAIHQGILPSIALHGMAVLRSSTKKILDKFHSKMDGAFLVHRGLLLPNDDAFEQLPELLAEEALAVITDQWIPSEQADKICEEAIDSAGLTLRLENKSTNGDLAPGQVATELLKKGTRSVQSNFDPSKDKKWIEKLHRGIGATETNSDKRLATLFNIRTQYSENRDLTFGTIIREQRDGKFLYSVCLMPLCDSIRLSDADEKVYQFPFWRLRTSNSGATARGVVVETPDEEFEELFVMGKPRDQLWMSTFRAGPTRTVAAVEEENKHIFQRSDCECGLQWVAQLKPSHMQRIAQDAGNSFSRVAVAEAEWLRLKSERGS